MRLAEIVLVTCLTCVCFSAYGDEHNVYKVELIVFRNIDSQGAGAENAFYETLWPDLENAVELSGDPSPSGYQILTEFDKELGSIAALLARSPKYEVITHLVWRQRMLDRSLTKPLHIHGGVEFSRQYSVRTTETRDQDDEAFSDEAQRPLPLLQIDGTVKLYVGRYLHINTDLVYRQPGVLSDVNTEGIPPEQAKVLIDYPVRNTRKMRSGELHYLDHPLLGILVKITTLKENAQS